MDPNRFYVYAYLREDGTPYYIGKGQRYRYKSPDHTIPVPPEDRIEFIQKNMLEEDALELEKQLIEKYGRKCNNTGILRNLTEGGSGGMSGAKLTAEHRAKIGQYWKGRKHAQETKDKCSAANKGRKHTQKFKDRRRELMTGKRWYNDGINTILTHIPPDDTWVLGRLLRSKNGSK